MVSSRARRMAELPAQLIGLAVLLASDPSQAQAGADQLRVVDVAAVAPMVRQDSRAAIDGRAAHRRIISKPKDGSVNLDVGFNTYRAGLIGDVPYAYTRDEICYLPSGEVEVESDGVAVLTRPGIFMWRPAGAPTERTHILKDSITICAFAPARDDEWSHRLPPQEVGRWDGEEANRPRVRFYHFKAIKPRVSDGGRIAERRVVSSVKDGAVHADAAHFSYKAGAHLDTPSSGNDQICWLESGRIEFVHRGAAVVLKAGQFLYRPAGATVRSARVLLDSVAICFTGPARRES